MIALGIDPGTAICGFGFVENLRGELSPINYGVITTSPQALMQDRLLKIYSELDALISNFKPNVIAVEKLFFGKNSTTAITVRRLRRTLLYVKRGFGFRDQLNFDAGACPFFFGVVVVTPAGRLNHCRQSATY